MTFAIVAWDERTGMLGAAAASSTSPTQGWSLHGHPAVGIIACGGVVDARLGIDGLRHLDGADPRDAVLQLLESDPGRDSRQVLIVDSRGRTAAYSGRGCLPFFGHTEGTDHVAGGDALASPNVVGAMSLSFERSGGDPLWERLLLALESGDRAGGDRRGRRSAALLVYEAEAAPLVDIRVEAHLQPTAELRRLLSGKSPRPGSRLSFPEAPAD